MFRRIALLALGAGFLLPAPAHAIRPFVTDDARVVGHKLAQLETWLLVDRLLIEHTALAAVGPTDWLELAAGVVQGGAHSGADVGYSLTGPIVQAKALLAPAKSNAWPGVAVATGTFAPYGFGALAPPDWSGFGYLALTQNIDEETLLIHANLGVVVGDQRSKSEQTSALHEDVRAGVTAGLGAQLKIVGGFHGMAEVYFGDPYDARFEHPAMQVGARYIFGPHVQADVTFGSTLVKLQSEDGRHGTEQWGTVGIRLVTPELW